VPTLSSRIASTILGLLVLAGSVGHSAQFVVAVPDQPALLPGEAPFDLGGDDVPDIVAGTGGGGGTVSAFSGADLSLLAGGSPFGSGFTGGVRVAAGDIDGDGVTDVVTAMRTGGGRVRVFSGATLTVLADFDPYGAGFSGGVSVALGDTNGDGHADLVVGPGSGVAPVRVYSGADGALLLSGAPFGGDAGGVNVAAGDITGDGLADVVVAQARGSLVSVFSAVGLAPLGSGAPYGPAFTGGVSVAVGDVNGDGRGDIITAPASGAGQIRAYDLAGPTLISSGYPFGPAFAGGVRVAASDFDGDGRDDIVASAGAGSPHVRVFSVLDQRVLGDFFAFDPAFAGGVEVAAPRRTGIRITSPSTATFTVGTDGTFTIRTEGRPAVTTIAQTGALPAGVHFTDNGDGTATLSGTPTPGAGGAYPLTLTASNGTPRPATQDFVLRVEEAPAFTSAASATFRVAEAATFDVITQGFPIPEITLSGVLPAGVTFTDLDNGRATLSGTPLAGSGGTYALTISATNGVGGTVVQSFSLTVETGAVFTSPSSVTFVVGTANTFTVTTTGEPVVTSITRTGTLPGGLTFTDNGDGTATLSGTAAAGTGGTYPQTLTATNGVGTPAVQTLTITVQQGPQITSAATTTFVAATPGSFTIVATGTPVPSIGVSGTLPAGVTFADNGDGTGTLSGTPAAGGTFPLTVTASNGVGTPATQSFTLTVNVPPAFTSAPGVTFVVGTANTFGVTTTGQPAVTSITRTGTLPGGLTFTDNGNGTATLAGTAAAGTGGTYPQTLTATNGVGTPAVQILTITVQQAPEITSAATTTFVAGTAGSFTVVATGAPTPALTATGALPSGVTFVDNGDGTGTLSGTPAAGGTFPLTVTASNGVGTPATQSFTLTVQQAPAIISAAGTSFNVGAAGSFQVTTTGVPTPSISVSGVLPSGVTFTDNGDGTGTLSGTPAAGTSGTYPLTITAANGVGTPAVQNFSLVVQAPPAFTSASSTTFTVGTASSFTVTASGAPAPTLSMTGTLPTGVTFTPATGALGGTPTQTGTFSGIQFTAANGVPPDATQSFTLTVACPVITISATVLPGGTYNTAYGPVTFTASGSTGTSLTWSATGLPAGLAIGPTTGSVSGTPSTTVVDAAVGITVTDEYGCSSSRNLTVTVRPTATGNAYSNGVGNTQFVVGATQPSTPHVFASGSVLDNDSGPGTLSATVTTPATNGIVAMNTNGTFVYTPSVGFAGPSDAFVYTLTDGNGVTNTATVTIGLGGVVWYVNNAGASGDGRSHNPFNSLAGASAPSLAGQAIFVHSGVGTTPGSLALKAGQTLWGQGATFVVNGLTIPAGARPTLGGTVTLASSSTIAAVGFNTGSAAAINDPAGAITGVTISNGVAIATTTGVAVALSDASGSFTFDSISVNGAANAISLTNVAGPFTVSGTGAAGSGGTIQNIAGDAVRLSNTTGLVSFAQMIFQDIGNMTGAINTVSGDQAIHGEQVNGGLALNGVTMRRLSDHAILGSQLASPGAATIWNGLSITNSLIENSNRFHVASVGDGGDEAMVRVLGLRGTVLVTGSTLRSGNEPLDLLVTSGALAMTATANSFQAYKEDITGGPQPTVGQHCIDVVVQGSATASVTIGDRVNAGLGNAFLNCRVGSVRILHDTAATGTVDAVVARNTFVVDDHSSPSGDFFFPMGGVFAGSYGAASSSMNVLALGNTFDEVTNASGGVGQLTIAAEGGQFQARVDGNTFDTPGNGPWFIRAAENASGRIELRNNTVVAGTFVCPDPSCGGGYPAPGLRAIADVQRGGQLHVTIDNDFFAQHDTGFDPGNTVEIQGNNVGAAPTVCAALRGNQSADGYALEQSAGTFNLYNWLSATTGTCTSASPGTCTTVLAANNNTGGAGNPATTPPAVSIAGTISVSAAACQVPSGGIFQP